MSVVIETTMGDLTVDLFISERPIACLNFLKLCRLKYYNFNLFHTVQQGFIAQTGDPSGAGDGGSSIWGVVEGPQKRFFEAEFLPKINHSSAGMLSLVSAGKNLVGSQFFLTLGENLTSLDCNHCVIGEVVEGHEVLRKLNDAIVDDSFRPYQDIRITHTVVLEDPFPNPRGLQAPSRSPSPSAERLKNGRIAADEDIDDTDGMTAEEMQEMLAEREAKARATILEIVGDLPDADMAPPENVLFVCKLNPVTTDDDLEIIFSSFGVLKGCEVIRDRKTGDSLQYAFVEFEDQKSCEAAYFKMDNVLIDDRRIHVDFSQSVSKVTWRGKGRGIEGDYRKLDFNNLRDDKDHRKPNNGRSRTEDHKERNRTEDFRNRMSSAERRKAREQRHQEQSERDVRKNLQRRTRSMERDEKSGYRSKKSQNESVRENSNRERNRNEKRSSRSRDTTHRRYSRSRDREERRRSRPRDQLGRRSRSRDQKERRRSRPREQNERRRSRSRDQTGKRPTQNRDRNDSRRFHSPQEGRRNDDAGGSHRETSRNQRRSPERRQQSRNRENHRMDTHSSPNKSHEKKRKLSVEKSKKQAKKSKRAASSSSDSRESSSESESDSTSSDSSEDSSSSSSSSDDRSKRKKSTKSKQKKSKSKSSHKSKKKHNRN